MAAPAIADAGGAGFVTQRRNEPACRVRADVVTLQVLHYCVVVTDGLLARDQPDAPVRQAFPDVLDILNTEISRTRNGTAEIGTVLAELDLIGCVEAGQVLNLGARRVAQIADELGGVKVGGRGGYVFHRPTVIAYAERQRNRE